MLKDGREGCRVMKDVEEGFRVMKDEQEGVQGAERWAGRGTGC